jgi:cytoskeletal protein CcmA (bactofilin family)
MLKRKKTFTSDMGYSADQDGNYIISGTRITGDILSENNILIEGEILGNIACKGKVTIGNTGLVKGNISCYTSEIFGTIEGEIKVEDVLNLRDTSKIYGNIYTTKLKIDEGAFFEGSCKMSSSTKSTVEESNTLMSDLIQEEDIIEE